MHAQAWPATDVIVRTTYTFARSSAPRLQTVGPLNAFGTQPQHTFLHKLMSHARAPAPGPSAARMAAAAEAAAGARGQLAQLLRLAALPHAPGHHRLPPCPRLQVQSFHGVLLT